MCRKCLTLSALVLLLIIPTLAGQSAAQSSDSEAKHESLSVGEAMKMFYGNYNSESQTSTFNLPDGAVGGVLLAKNDSMLATSFFSGFTNENGSPKFMLLTYALPKDSGYSCHACAPVIGMAVFKHVGQEWTIDSLNQAVMTSGGYGQPPTGISIVQIGRGRPAIEIRDSGSGGGETTSVLLILVPWKGTVNLALERIIADNDAGMCGDVACYSYHRTVEYLRKASTSYYDLKLTLKGTDFGDTSSRSRRVRGVEILQFQGGKYIQVSRKGDLTNTDKSVATREGLK